MLPAIRLLLPYRLFQYITGAILYSYVKDVPHLHERVSISLISKCNYVGLLLQSIENAYQWQGHALQTMCQDETI